VIKTTIVERAAAEQAGAAPAVSPALKAEILTACRQMILNLLRERGER
jgi:2-keto-3-deoxy-6-phosphogluconate aldolase